MISIKNRVDNLLGAWELFAKETKINSQFCQLRSLDVIPTWAAVKTQGLWSSLHMGLRLLSRDISLMEKLVARELGANIQCARVSVVPVAVLLTNVLMD